MESSRELAMTACNAQSELQRIGRDFRTFCRSVDRQKSNQLVVFERLK